MRQVKLSEEDLQKIRKVRESYNDIINKMGQLDLQKHDITKVLEQIDAKKDELLYEYDESKKTEKEILDVMSNKYGVGTLNIETGYLEVVDTPNSPTD